MKNQQSRTGLLSSKFWPMAILASGVLSVLSGPIGLASPPNAKAQSNSYLITAPTLKAPEKGTVAGALDTSFLTSSSSLTKGSFELPLPISLPSKRGGLLFPFSLSYSPSSGMSEWGMGIHFELSIYRWREDHNALYTDQDELMSPWGLLKKGQDSYWYPTGLTARVRVSWEHPEEIKAYLENGTTLVFGGSAAIKGDGSKYYAWYLVSATHLSGEKSTFHYEIDPQGASYPTLTSIEYGGRGENPAYRLQLSYDKVPIPVTDYRSGHKMIRNKRISKVAVFSSQSQNQSHGQSVGTSGSDSSVTPAAVTQSWKELYSYAFTFQKDANSLKQYLIRLQRTFADGVTEAPVELEYNDPQSLSEEVLKAEWKHLPEYDPIIQKFTRGFYRTEIASPIDWDESGNPAFEFNQTREVFGLDLNRQFFSQPLLTEPDSQNRGPCRMKNIDAANSPRQFFRPFGPGTELYVLATLPEPGKTDLVFCDREGYAKSRGVIEGGTWDLKENAQLVMFNRNGKPDLARQYSQTTIQIAENISTPETGIRFQKKPPISLGSFSAPATGNWFEDLNGDGILDVIVRNKDLVKVWFGKGNYQFDPNGITLYFWLSSTGQNMTTFNDYEFAWGDLNHDGLTDLIMVQPENVRVFLNQINHTDPAKRFVSVPFQLPKKTSDLSFWNPQFLDLAGTGNPQIVIYHEGKLLSLELVHAGTGLLKSVKDGKGRSLKFEYERMKAEAGIRHREILFSSVTVSSTGEPTTTYHVSLSEPHFYSKNHLLLGFGKLIEKEETVSGAILQEKIKNFLLDDHAPGLLLSEKVMDPRLPQLHSIQQNEYETKQISGLPVEVVKKSLQGFENSNGSQVSTTTEYEYDDHLCLHAETTQMEQGTLKKSFHRAKIPGFHSGPHEFLHCLESTVKIEGHHPQSELNFSSNTHIDRNPDGQPARITTESGKAHRVEQEITYNSEHQIASIKSPAQGEVKFEYHHSLLSRILEPSGKVIEVSQRDPKTEEITEWVQNLGDSSAFRVDSRFDDWGRVISQWDNLQLGSEASPLTKWSYHFPDELRPGTILTESRVDLKEGNSWNRAASFVSANGQSLAEAENESADSWIIRNTTLRESPGETVSYGLRRQQIPTLFAKGSTAGQEVGGVSLAELLQGAAQGASVISKASNSLFGLSLQSMRSIQRGIENHLHFEYDIQGKQLILKRKEADRAGGSSGVSGTEKEIHFIPGFGTSGRSGSGLSGSEGNLLETRIVNEEGVAQNYSYDVLGRLRKIEIPKGAGKTQEHSIRYDSFGRIESITRSEVGQIHFEYDPVTALLTKKVFLGHRDPKKVDVAFQHEWKYDALGRVVEFTQQDLTLGSGSGKDPHNTQIAGSIAPSPSNRKRNSSQGKMANAESFTYFYDGQTPQGAIISGQKGLLTGIKGPGFSRTMTYRPDGKMVELHLDLSGWGTLKNKWIYGTDGRKVSRIAEIQPLKGESKRLEWRFETDALGRPKQTLLNQQTLLTLEYDTLGLLTQAQLAGGGKFTPTYDSVTHQPQGFQWEAGNTDARFNWDLNYRGWIQEERISTSFLERITESLGLGSLGSSSSSNRLDRTYSYNPTGTLSQDRDSSESHEYRYDPTGLVSQFTYGSKTHSIEPTSLGWSVGDGKSPADSATLYEQDEFGRIQRMGEKIYHYGPLGRMHSLDFKDSSGKLVHVEYVYDEEGRRLAKKKNGEWDEIYLSEGVWKQKENSWIEPVKVDQFMVGVTLNDRFEPILSDIRGTVLKSANGDFMALAPYGDERKERLSTSYAVDYASVGYDEDLGAYRMEYRDYDPRLKQFLTPDPLFLESPEKCLESPMECNLYGYAGGNPVSLTDTSGLLTVIIPGTYANITPQGPVGWAAQGSEFNNSVSQTFGEPAITFHWNYGNNTTDRTEAAFQLAKLINSYQLADGEKINIVAHSHGGNVVKEASHLIFGKSIDTIVNLGTPQRTDYQMNGNTVNSYINVYSTGDMVQVLGSGNQGGLSGRTDFNALNIEAMGQPGHSKLHSSEVWNSISGSIKEAIK